MGITRSEKTRRVVLLLAPCILILTVILSIGSAYGRYITELRGDNAVTVRPKDVAYVTGSDWTTVGSTHTMTFSLANVEDEKIAQNDMSVRVRFFAPAEAGIPAVTLNVDGSTYTLTACPLSEKTPMYNERGEGSVYKLQSANGEEHSFFLGGGQAAQYSMTVTVTGTDSIEGFKLDVLTTETK